MKRIKTASGVWFDRRTGKITGRWLASCGGKKKPKWESGEAARWAKSAPK